MRDMRRATSKSNKTDRLDPADAILSASPLGLGCTSEPAHESELPKLVVPANAVTDDVVVSAPRPTAYDILQPIRSHDVDLTELTNGLVDGAKRTSDTGALTDGRIAAEAARAR